MDLRRERRLRGLLLRDVASEVGISESLLSGIERGRRPSPPTAKRIADYFETTIEDIWPNFGDPDPDDEPVAA